ncbi:DegT/DnrJ/EryC1/StrS family aminotransferase [bacterium]|nr:DegT/DnrJ/EryC1/StrS family aminotransferase [bacterium]
MQVPFVDLKSQYQSIKSEVWEKLEQVMSNTAFVGGPFLKEFEREFAGYIGTEYAYGVSSGTSALHLSLLATGITEGAEVITVANTFIATVEPICFVGAKPVFVDMDPRTYNIDVSKIEAAITGKTRAIIPVHLYGQAADMDAIMAIAKKHNLIVIEDCCQAHGAEYKGKKVGTFGNVSAYSFYPGKNLGAYGDGGMVVTNDPNIGDKIALFKDHGSVEKFKHTVIGYNYRLDAMQAAILNIKLKYIDQWNGKRVRNAELYDHYLRNLEITIPHRSEYNKHVYHLYVIQSENRDELRTFLNERGVASGLHYPIPCHLQKGLEYLNYREGDFPETEKLADHLVSLPMFPELTEDQIKYVADCIAEFQKLG